ncbi:MAG TPA: SIR2 family protein [Bryobacteraceae bacterium]|jgi:hypothetical protein|nr:SIR2 family protein [Bryobacteraceae bacterium]
MFSSDAATFDSLKKLWGLATVSNRKPLLIWVGAGASSWLGYERWEGVARVFHRSFIKSVASYRRVDANRALAREEFPTVFQLCYDADPQRYRSLLAGSFSPLPMKPVYTRFLDALTRIDGASLVTTNVDEMLERSLPGFELLQRSDISRAVDLLSSNTRFIAKIHGSISSIETVVFRNEDYQAIAKDQGFIECVKHLLDTCSVVFIGYGMRDQYLIELLSQTAAVHSLFGTGPHFLISTTLRPELPSSVNVVQYRTDFHTDHRSSILSLEVAARPRSETDSCGQPLAKPSLVLRSAHLLSDFYPAGTWTSGNMLALRDANGERTVQMIVGPDWVVGEIPPYATAAHDLAIGLICFDHVLIPLECIPRLFELVGGSLFETLLNEDVLQFIHWEGYDSVCLQSDQIGFGYLATGATKTEPLELIRRLFSAVPGREAEATALMSRIERKVTYVDLSGSRNFADICNGLFVSPATRAILGVSEATPAGRIPRWAAHPVLRVVQVARIGATCQRSKLGSMKLMAGAAKVAEIAFSAVAEGVLATEPGSYVLTGQYGVICENEFKAQPGVWDAIMQFRNQNSGMNFRKEILKLLRDNEAAEVIPAIDSSLRQMVPTDVLARSRLAMSSLLAANGIDHVVPAVWSDSTLLNSGTQIWRARTKQRFTTYLSNHGIGVYDLCPCGSFERVKFCCMASLEF